MPIPYTCARTSWVPGGVADGTTFNSASYDAYLAASNRIARITEVYEGGEASASTVNVMALRRDQTSSATPAQKTPRQNNPYSQNATGTYFQDATTQATPGSQHMLQLSYNSWGGAVRWVAYPGEEVYVIGGAALPNNEVSYSGVSGSPGTQSSHFVVEEM